MEHRWDTRIQTDLPVTIHTENHRFEGRIINLGLNGLFASPDRDPDVPKHTTLTMDVALPTAQGYRAFEVPALVVHTSGTGFGVLFQAVDGEFADALMHFIESRAPGPGAAST